jgi:hypothetical protein
LGTEAAIDGEVEHGRDLLISSRDLAHGSFRKCGHPFGTRFFELDERLGDFSLTKGAVDLRTVDGSVRSRQSLNLR